MPIAAGRHLVRVTVSVGVASGTGLEPTALIRAADKALYLSKDAGRNKTTLASLPHIQQRLIAQGVN